MDQFRWLQGLFQIYESSSSFKDNAFFVFVSTLSLSFLIVGVTMFKKYIFLH